MYFIITCSTNLAPKNCVLLWWATSDMAGRDCVSLFNIASLVLHWFYITFEQVETTRHKTNHALHYTAREYLRCCCQCKQQGLTHCSLAVHKQALSVKRKSKNNQEKVSIKLDTQVCLRETQYNLLARFIIADKKTNEKYKAALRTLCVITLPVCGGSVRASTIPCSWWVVTDRLKANIYCQIKKWRTTKRKHRDINMSELQRTVEYFAVDPP